MPPVEIDRKTPIEELPELLRVEEAARWLDVSRGVLYEMIRRNEIASVRIGGLVRIPRSALAKLTEAA